MKAFFGYVLLPFREVTSIARLFGAIAVVTLNALIAWDRLSLLPQKKYWFAYNLFAVGYHVALIERYRLTSPRFTNAHPVETCKVPDLSGVRSWTWIRKLTEFSTETNRGDKNTG